MPRIIDCASFDDMLNLLAAKNRPSAMLAIVQSLRFEFTSENPTGHYDLDLSNEEERELAAELVEMARAQSLLEQRLDNYYRGRYGGPREVKDRCWRNSTLDGRRFSPRLAALPDHGLLSFDFVKLARHGKTLEQMEELTLDDMCGPSPQFEPQRERGMGMKGRERWNEREREIGQMWM